MANANTKLNIAYLPSADVTTSYFYLRAWGRQMLRAIGFVGVDVARREAWLWAVAEEIASVHERLTLAAAYQTLVELAVRGRGGMVSDE